MLDSLPIFASLNFMVSSCDCCNRSGIKRTVEISSSEIDTIYLGSVCCGRWFDVNMSGNPYKAIKRLNKKLRELSNEQVESIVENIRDAQNE